MLQLQTFHRIYRWYVEWFSCQMSRHFNHLPDNAFRSHSFQKILAWWVRFLLANRPHPIRHILAVTMPVSTWSISPMDCKSSLSFSATNIPATNNSNQIKNIFFMRFHSIGSAVLACWLLISYLPSVCASVSVCRRVRKCVTFVQNYYFILFVSRRTRRKK